MPLEDYGVLKGRPLRRRFADDRHDHYRLYMKDGREQYQVVINVHSQIDPPDLEYCLDPDFRHPITQKLRPLFPGFTPLRTHSQGLALDYIRSRLLQPSQFRSLPYTVPGPDNDLNEKIDRYVQLAIQDDRALVYVFGEWYHNPPRWNDDPTVGMHNVHMNQGNSRRFQRDDGPWQDGAVLFHFPGDRRWIALFLKFQSQSWETDDRTGHAFYPEASGY